MLLQDLKPEQVYQALHSLVLFQGIKQDEVFQRFAKIIKQVAEGETNSAVQLLGEYHNFLGMLLEKTATGSLPMVGNPWQDYLLNLILFDDNLLAREAVDSREISPFLQQACLHDLSHLQILYLHGLSCLTKISHNLPGAFKLPDTMSSTSHKHFVHPAGEQILDLKQQFLASLDWRDQYPSLLHFYRSCGFGQFALYRAFRFEAVSGGYQLKGITQPDPIRLHQLIGYERQRKQVLDNTERLLQGRPALNLLLYGDRGTGKSSTVKALLNEYGNRGLRLVQVPRRNLEGLQELTGYLSSLPLKFIIFIDDLSFEEAETDYKEFKTQLEGSLERPAANLCIYVTSNQRNLIKEYFGERENRLLDNGEVHAGDTMQEKLSLADRFGLKITFLSPDKEAYLKIVRELARQENITIDTAYLEKLALRWTLWHNERSGRTARQFIDHLKDRDNLEELS